MTTKTVTAEPNWDLSTINTFVAQQENVLQGPLTKIGNDGSKTTLDIDLMGGKPKKNAMITTGNLPAGATEINTAQIYISGALTAATSYRPA
jgi:hypothetical protein